MRTRTDVNSDPIHNVKRFAITGRRKNPPDRGHGLLRVLPAEPVELPGRLLLEDPDLGEFPVQR